MKYVYLSYFAVFMTVMIVATVIAYSRQSGSTGLDMSKVQKMRYDAVSQSP